MIVRTEEAQARLDAVIAGWDFSPVLTRALHRMAAADGEALLQEWQDRADDALIGSPGVPGNRRLAAYCERWIVAAKMGWSGPFDERFGNIRQGD